MTTLKVATSDQTLIAMEKVKIASGDIESVFLDVEFCEAWGSFINRTASFYTSYDSTVHEILLIDDHCIIPAEVLAKPGTLYVGIVGVSADGSAVKTSAITGFKISQGAVHGYSTIAPELDAFQQYLAAMKAETAPMYHHMLGEVDELIAATQVRVNEALGGIAEWNLDENVGKICTGDLSAELTSDANNGKVLKTWAKSIPMINNGRIRLALKYSIFAFYTQGFDASKVVKNESTYIKVYVNNDVVREFNHIDGTEPDANIDIDVVRGDVVKLEASAQCVGGTSNSIVTTKIISATLKANIGTVYKYMDLADELE